MLPIEASASSNGTPKQVCPHPSGNVVCIPVVGSLLNAEVAAALVEESRDLLQDGARAVVIDFARVSQIDLHGLLRLSRLETLGTPGAIALAGLRPGPLRVVRAVALHRRLDVFASRRAALEAYR